MTDDVITDLKLFISTTVGQQIAELDTTIDQKIDNLDAKLSQKLDDLMGMVGDVLYDNNESNGRQFKDHERRIRRLEKKLAS